jgi:hypothetical protein
LRARRSEGEEDRLLTETEALLPRLAEARRRYAMTMSDADWSRLVVVQNEAAAFQANFYEAVGAAGTGIGLPSDVLAKIGELGSAPDGHHLPRRNLTQERTAITGQVDEQLPRVLSGIQRLLPAGWIEADPQELCRLDALSRPKNFLSLTKGLRQESEAPATHRFRQALRVSQDYLAEHPTYDHFAGATLVPSMTQLGSQLENLKLVGGEVERRLQHLWSGPSVEVDATIMEVLTAGRCAEYGRDVEFIAATNGKSPDLPCHHPFPLVIECKRQQALSEYEIAEEAIMRELFAVLRAEAVRLGVCGRFSLRLDIEASALDREEVVRCLVRQRLVPHPERELSYPWGQTAFIELPRRLDLGNFTKLYSPWMLEEVFEWRSDLPMWDGLCCWISNARELTLSEVRIPVGLVWNNTSQSAMRKRTWAPTNLFGTATNQIRPGEVGIVYVAYLEGAREEDVADLRVRAYFERIEAWDHAANIRIPATFLSRLYPRPLGHGEPDLIESTIQLSSGTYGHPVLFELFPTTIFTRSP